MLWLNILGWVLVPYVMIFIKWRRMHKALRFVATVWALIIFANTVYLIRGKPSDSTALNSTAVSTSAQPSQNQNEGENTSSVTATTNVSQSAQSNTSADSSTSNTSKVRYVPVETYGRVGDLEVRVNSLQQVKSVGYDGIGDTADGAFWVINVTIKNDGSSPLAIVDDIFHLQDINGDTYQPDSTAEIYANTDAGTMPTNLNPGVSMTTNIVFDMPDFMTYRHIGQHYSLVASMGLFGTNETTYDLP
ncbi:DUF4352 domain-containing protein [Alicyclobacillus hesperidum]|uniref:DUF4352 domain-containing protein n=2 Tax=Alicyclobacillus hesperidum TaxID=89784 RepID=UPI00249085C9|nr:DUF4352 domain-containing protein [Alicyclobacillus hesperidum]